MKLAIIATHPIQYYAPWYRHLVARAGIDLKVYYLWDYGAASTRDLEFGTEVLWDVPLLDGYPHLFMENTSSDPGTHRFGGLRNPGLLDAVAADQPDAVLLTAYNFRSTMEFILRWDRSQAPMLFRGDSHRLVPRSGAGAGIRRRAIAALFSRFAAVLCVGKANREYFLQHGVPADRLFLSPHAVDNERFFAEAAKAEAEASEWRLRLGIPPEEKVVLFAGKFIPKKRPDLLLEAFMNVDPVGSHLVFVGAGQMEGLLKEKAGSNRRVHFLPLATQAQMPVVLAIADLVVLPSEGSGETWGLVINEAMCMSRAVLVSDHVGCASDLVHHGENGLIFPAGDRARLADALVDALGSQTRLKEWGARGRAIIAEYDYHAATKGLQLALSAVGPPAIGAR